MKDFGRWFSDQGSAAPASAAPVDTLDNQLEALGFGVHKDGSVWGRCCMCGGAIRLTDYIGREEIARDVDPENQYCGGSPRCCP